mmetsp:Transcript_26664/g.73335  ORF Transcript_26664/g.73335 Transcript_26664/m.73335 type:complete len:2366 (+) Transcript_26664:359-7456(+)
MAAGARPIFDSALAKLLFLTLLLSAIAKPIASEDDFADVNAIIRDVAIKLQDVPTLDSGGYSISLTDVVCRDISIGDASLVSRRMGLVNANTGATAMATTSTAASLASGVELQWSIESLAFQCTAEYKYKGLLGMINRGEVYLNSRDNRAAATAVVSSPLKGSPTPPTNSIMTSCDPTVEIVDVDFDNGGFVGWILDAIEGLLRTTMEGIAADKICEELKNFIESDTKDLMEYIAGQNALGPYLTGDGASTDSVELQEQEFFQRLKLPPPVETNATAPSTGLMKFREQETSTGRWMNEWIQKAVLASNELISVSNAQSVVETTELQVNQWLRDVVLDKEDGSLVLTSSSGDGFPNDGILYDGEDLVTHTTIVLDRVKLLGLDTLTDFSPFAVIGEYTLETTLAWKYLALEVDVTVTVRPSTRPGSVIETPDGTSAKIVEQVKVMLGIDGLTAGAALMVALNQTALEETVKLGSLIRSDTAAIDCLLSTLLDLECSDLSVHVTNDVLTPSIKGLVSPGLDRLVSQAMDASSLMYKDVLMEAAPPYFQTELRPMLTQNLLREYLLQRPTTGNIAESSFSSSGDNNKHGNSRACFQWTTEDDNGLDDKAVDFRDLLLPAEEAILLGGSGSEVYGDLFSETIMPYLNEDLLDPDALNEQWMSRITKEQSGNEGVIEFNDVFRYLNTSSTSPLYDTLDVRISKITISNLDTAGEPLEFLKPTEMGNILENRLTLHSVADDTGRYRFLNVTFRVHVGIDGESSPFQMTNVVDFSVSIPAASLSVAVLADLKERSLFEFPLKDIANPYCWLAAFGSENTEDGEIEAERIKNLAISSLSFNILTFYLDSNCVSTTSPGCDSISNVIDELENAGFASSFRSPIIGLVENVVLSMWDALDVAEWIKDAPRHCPHSSSFSSQATKPTFKVPDLSGMSRNSSETILGFGIVALQTIVIVSAKNHLLSEGVQNPPESINESSQEESNFISFPEGEGLVDWTNLTDLGSWVESAFDQFRDYLSTSAAAVSSDNDLSKRGLFSKSAPRINDMLRQYVLDEFGFLELEPNVPPFTILGVTISLSKLRIGGLDTITKTQPLVVLDSHKLSNELQLDELIVAFECNITTAPDASPDQIELVYKAKDIRLDMDTKLALNTTEIAKIRVGSLFNVSQITNCMTRGIQAFEISKLNVTFGQLLPSTLKSSSSSELHFAVNSILESLHNTYQNELIQAMPLIATSTVRKIINAQIPDILDSAGKKCPSPPEFQTNGVIDFRELFLPAEESEKLGGSAASRYGDLFQTMYDILEKEVMQVRSSSRPVLNDWLKTLTMKQSNVTGTIKVADSAFNTEAVIQIAGFRADFGMEISDILIENLDSVGDPLYFLQPVDGEANVLDNKLSFGVDEKPLRFKGTLSFSLDDGAEAKIRNEVTVSFLIEDVTIQTSMLLQILENSISSFPLEDFSDPYCWASTILSKSEEETTFRGLKFFGQNYSTGDFAIDISCKSCTSPDFDKLISSLYEPQDITSAVEMQTGSLMESGFVQTFLNDAVVESKKRCPHHPEYDPEYESVDSIDFSLLSDAAFGLARSEQKQNPTYFSIANSVVASCLIIAGLLGKVAIARMNKKWIESLSNEGQFLFDRQRKKERITEEWLDENTTSLFASSSIPKFVRWGVPILIILNLVLYLGGHFGLISIVNLEVALAGESFTIRNFLEFRFLDSTWQTYQNGGAEMVILLWIFTGIWPYIKLILSLIIWVVPPKYLGVKQRGTMLLWIDALARLSIIDIFTLIIGFAILFVFIGGRDSPNDGEGAYYALKAIVVPKAGCYCIVVAQRISRVSSQFLLEYHEIVVDAAVDVLKDLEGNVSISRVVTDQQLEGAIPLDIGRPSVQITESNFVDESQFTFESTRKALSQTHRDQSIFDKKSWEVYRWGQLGAILGGVTILIVFIIGCVFVPAIAIDVTAVGGITLDSDYTYDEAVSEYGVFLVISGVLLKARFVNQTKADYIGLGLLLFAAAVTISSIFMIKVFQFIRKRIQKKRQRRNDLDQEPPYGHEGCGLPSYFRLYKWRHMEIYFVSVCIGVWQLGSVVSYSIHLYCSILTGVFDILTSIGIVESTEAQCNQIQATLPGNLVITLGSFLILLITFYLQARWQFKKNLVKASENVDDQDVPALSLAWSRDKSKNSRYSHLTESLSLSAVDSDATSSRTGRTSLPNLSDSPDVNRFWRYCHSRSLSTRSSTRSHHSPPLSPVRDCIIDEDSNEHHELSVAEISGVSDDNLSRCTDRSSAIDAVCELAVPPNHCSAMNLLDNLERREDTSTHIENRVHALHAPLNLASRSFDDTASTKPPSPPPSPSITSLPHSRSPSPQFRSTYEYLHYVEENPDLHDV